MLALDQKYKPATIGGFAGLGHAKALLGTLRDNPWPSSWLLTGDSGIGKTSMAFALGREMKAEIHHIESRACNVATVQEVISRCHYMPFGGGWHLIICDEADRMTDAAQVNWLSILDGTQMPPQTVVMFTSNSTARLESRFLSRCRVINFSARKNIADSAVFLRTIWELESTAPPPDFTALLVFHNLPYGDGRMLLLVRNPYFAAIKAAAAVFLGSGDMTAIMPELRNHHRASGGSLPVSVGFRARTFSCTRI